MRTLLQALSTSAFKVDLLDCPPALHSFIWTRDLTSRLASVCCNKASKLSAEYQLEPRLSLCLSLGTIVRAGQYKAAETARSAQVSRNRLAATQLQEPVRGASAGAILPIPSRAGVVTATTLLPKRPCLLCGRGSSDPHHLRHVQHEHLA